MWRVLYALALTVALPIIPLRLWWRGRKEPGYRQNIGERFGRYAAARPDKPLIWLHGEVRSPPLSGSARVATGVLLRRLQRGELLELPRSRPMSVIGKRCHELRIDDAGATWRLIYRIDDDAIVVLDVFKKKTRATPASVIARSQRRLGAYDAAGGGQR